MIRLLRAATGLALLCVAACVDTRLPDDSPENLANPVTGTITYRCDGNTALVVSYARTGDASSVVINVDGPETLLEEPSPTGRRFAWPSDGSYHIWELTGAGGPGAASLGTLSYRDGEKGTTTPVLTNCRA